MSDDLVTIYEKTDETLGQLTNETDSMAYEELLGTLKASLEEIKNNFEEGIDELSEDDKTYFEETIGEYRDTIKDTFEFYEDLEKEGFKDETVRENALLAIGDCLADLEDIGDELFGEDEYDEDDGEDEDEDDDEE